jgi:predicted nucleic acid-binding protein
VIFLDTSAIYALADKADPNHVAARTIVNDLNKLTSTMCHCERSEAISWDCHVASLLAMTTFVSRSV